MLLRAAIFRFIDTGRFPRLGVAPGCNGSRYGRRPVGLGADLGSSSWLVPGAAHRPLEKVGRFAQSDLKMPDLAPHLLRGAAFRLWPRKRAGSTHEA